MFHGAFAGHTHGHPPSLLRFRIGDGQHADVGQARDDRDRLTGIQVGQLVVGVDDCTSRLVLVELGGRTVADDTDTRQTQIAVLGEVREVGQHRRDHVLVEVHAIAADTFDVRAEPDGVLRCQGALLQRAESSVDVPEVATQETPLGGLHLDNRNGPAFDFIRKGHFASLLKVVGKTVHSITLLCILCQPI